MPTCSCIYFDPFNSLKLFEDPIYLDLARNSLSVLRKQNVLKKHQEAQEASWTSNLFTNIFDESSVTNQINRGQFFLDKHELNNKGMRVERDKEKVGRSWESMLWALMITKCYTKISWYMNMTRAGFTQHCYCSSRKSGDNIWFSCYLVSAQSDSDIKPSMMSQLCIVIDSYQYLKN